MGIDNLKKKKKKKPNQLVSKRKDGKRPGYYGSDDYGSGEDGQGGSSSSSSDNGGGDDNNYMDYYVSSTPSPAPSYSVQDDLTDYATNVGSTASVGGGFEDDDNDDYIDLGADRFAPITMEDVDVITKDNRESIVRGGYEPTRSVDTGESLYVSPTQITKENQPYVNYTPGPNAVTAAQLAAFNQNTGTSDNMFSLTENKIRATNPIEEPKKGILSTLGKFAKNAAINIGGTMVFGPSFPKMRNTYKTAQFIDDRFLNDKIPGISFAKGTGGKPPVGTGFDNDSGNNNIIAKNVVASNVQKYSPEYINRAIQYRDKLQAGVESGAVLSKIGQQTLTGLNQLINQYQVEPETMIT